MRTMFGEKLKDMPYGTGLYRRADYYAVKAPVFSLKSCTMWTPTSALR